MFANLKHPRNLTKRIFSTDLNATDIELDFHLCLWKISLLFRVSHQWEHGFSKFINV